jgi:hypothetical protein
MNRRVATAVVALMLALAPSYASAADRFSAFAVNLDSSTPLPTGAGQVEIVVNRQSSEAEAQRLTATLLEKGPEALLSELQKMPRIGYIRTPSSLGYDLRFARTTKDDEGNEVVTIITDRYINFWEAANRPRTIDYPFTVIELRINRDGDGEGKLSLFTKITGDKKRNTIVLENYGTQPVLLKSVRRTSSSD